MIFHPLFGIPAAIVALQAAVPSEIHVKVFPHLAAYEPQGKDLVLNRVGLRSDASCELQEGQLHRAASTGQVLSTVKSLAWDLTSADLKTPVWIQCQSPIQVVRQGARHNYAYAGPLYVHASGTGPEIIEVKPLNEYLKGVVPSEMPSDWPGEALKAQAVAARTFAVFEILYGRNPDVPQNQPSIPASGLYDVDDTVFFQAYTGETDRTPEADRAVNATKSEIMLHQGAVIQAYFSADAGGYTEDASHVWPVHAPYCKAKPEIYSQPPIDPEHWGVWTENFSLDHLNQLLKNGRVIQVDERVTAVEVQPQNRYPSGRAKTVSLHFQDGTVREVWACTFRKALGLRSTLFQMGSPSGSDPVTLQGRGTGHGVGMSQYGARTLAQVGGWNYQRILGFYYDSIVISQ